MSYLRGGDRTVARHLACIPWLAGNFTVRFVGPGSSIIAVDNGVVGVVLRRCDERVVQLHGWGTSQRAIPIDTVTGNLLGRIAWCSRCDRWRERARGRLAARPRPPASGGRRFAQREIRCTIDSMLGGFATGSARPRRASKAR